jgi:membrane glycosyltransferase
VAIAAASDAIPMAMRLSPLWLPLLLAVPLCVWTSRAQAGAWLRQRQLLLIPEEARTPALLQRSWPTPRLKPASPTPRASRRPVQPRPALVPAIRRGAWAVARVAALAAMVAVPVASIQEPNGSSVAFSYVAAAPAPWDAPIIAQVSLPRSDDIKTVSSGKRKPLRRPPPSSI